MWQRNTTFTPTDTAAIYTADHYLDYVSKDGGILPTLSASMVAITPGELPNSFYAYRLTTNGAGTSLGVNSLHLLGQRIEFGTRNLCGLNKKVTVSFYAKSSIANKKIGIALVQGYGSGGSPTASETIQGEAVTLTTSWVKYTKTFTTNTLVGKTFGTANNDSLELDLAYMWGSTMGTSFGYGAAETYVGSGTIDIAQVQLCAGDVALPFQPKSFEEELAKCMRYYQKSYNYSIAPGTATANGITYYTVGTATTAALYYLVKFSPTMRSSTPTVKTWDSAGSAEKVYKGGLGKTVAYPSGYTSDSSSLIGTTDATSASVLEFQWTAEAEL